MKHSQVIDGLFHKLYSAVGLALSDGKQLQTGPLQNQPIFYVNNVI